MIEWNVSPEIVTIGPLVLRWYGLLFASSFIFGYKIVDTMFKREGKTEKDLNDLVWYMVLGTVIGARLGHCIFYNPEFYLTNPLEISKIYRGGLASHGAAVGILSAIYLFVRNRSNITYLWMMDRIVIVVALAAFFIRTGNLFNSEIVGTPTNLPWGFVFLQSSSLSDVDKLIPRHPAQVYEAIIYLAIFIGLYWLYKKKYKVLQDGFLFGIFMASVFGFRFIVEFVKENQTYFEDEMSLNMGQWLSIPLVLAGLYLMYTKRKMKNNTT